MEQSEIKHRVLKREQQIIAAEWLTEMTPHFQADYHESQKLDQALRAFTEHEDH